VFNFIIFELPNLYSIFNTVNQLVYKTIYDSTSSEKSDYDLEEGIDRALASRFIDDTKDVVYRSSSENSEYDVGEDVDRGADDIASEASEDYNDYRNEIRSLEGAVRFLSNKLNDDREMFESRTTLLASQQLLCLSQIDAVFDGIERLTRKTSQVERLIRAKDERDELQEWSLLANQVMDEYERTNPPQDVQPATFLQTIRSNPYNKLSPNKKKVIYPSMPVTPTHPTANVTRVTHTTSRKSPPVSTIVTPAKTPTSVIYPYKRTAREMTSITISNPYNKRSNKR
jgi:hypothetical protein